MNHLCQLCCLVTEASSSSYFHKLLMVSPIFIQEIANSCYGNNKKQGRGNLITIYRHSLRNHSTNDIHVIVSLMEMLQYLPRDNVNVYSSFNTCCVFNGSGTILDSFLIHQASVDIWRVKPIDYYVLVTMKALDITTCEPEITHLLNQKFRLQVLRKV